MASICVIARRLRDGHVQYGWGGGAGYFDFAGRRLLQWYDTPDKVEYLFSLGQVSRLGIPGSENGGFIIMETHDITGTPHYLGLSEQEIFSKIRFVDYGYFYDLDNRWYYITNRPIHLKLPLELLPSKLDDRGYEHSYLLETEHTLFHHIFNKYMMENPTFATLLHEHNETKDSISELLTQTNHPTHYLYEHYKWCYNYFNPWVVCKVNDSCEDIIGFTIKPKDPKHLETIDW